IRETNLKKMGIQVADNFLFSKDGSWYRHPRFSKICFNWERIKTLAEGELVLTAESGSEEDEPHDKGEKFPSRRAGKEEIPRKTKKDYKIKTGENFKLEKEWAK